MFKKIKNIDSAFRDYRRYTLLVIGGSLFAVCFMAFECKSLLLKMQDKVYVLSGSHTFAASGTTRRDNLAVEARGHVRAFHELFFSLDPDEKVIQRHLRQALYLADGSAKKVYDSLAVAGYYSNIIAGNISQRISVDSVQVELKGEPYRFRCFATLQIIRSTSTVTRSLVTQGDMREVERSDNNLQGFLIGNWATIENKDLKIINH